MWALYNNYHQRYVDKRRSGDSFVKPSDADIVKSECSATEERQEKATSHTPRTMEPDPIVTLERHWNQIRPPVPGWYMLRSPLFTSEHQRNIALSNPANEHHRQDVEMTRKTVLALYRSRLAFAKHVKDDGNFTYLSNDRNAV
ncbi:hypothetical protein BC832DRAFT_431763 [Gaertneriomyces semiglobifer]|nr:hypothetical protein BC832DRAFT_431763 [Gaertneriomyces semiglobifer]